MGLRITDPTLLTTNTAPQGRGPLLLDDISVTWTVPLCHHRWGVVLCSMLCGGPRCNGMVWDLVASVNIALPARLPLRYHAEPRPKTATLLPLNCMRKCGVPSKGCTHQRQWSNCWAGEGNGVSSGQGRSSAQ